jgi:hypothetical protein
MDVNFSLAIFHWVGHPYTVRWVKYICCIHLLKSNFSGLSRIAWLSRPALARLHTSFHFKSTMWRQSTRHHLRQDMITTFWDNCYQYLHLTAHKLKPRKVEKLLNDHKYHGSKRARANSSWDPISKIPNIKRAGGVAQGVGPEFKPLYCKTKTTKTKQQQQQKTTQGHTAREQSN